MAEKLSAPKGTRDFLPGTMNVKEKIINEIEKIYKKYGFSKWDGPAFEYFKTLTIKSGPEVEKEIYYFKDKGNRELALRFELTASISRMIASNPSLKKPIKAYSIGKVWRYERPQQGRYREFFQSDTDIFGCDDELAEIELLSMARDILNELGFNDWKIFINNRKILNAFVRECGIPSEKKADVFRSMDKIHKIGVEGVKKEFIKKGLTEKNFFDFYNLTQNEANSNLDKLPILEAKLKSQNGCNGIKELRNFVDLWINLNGNDKGIEIDFSMVRGLDYYTGMIFEIIIESGPGIGSIASGGRYDELIETFGGTHTSACGISFGIERLIDIIESDEVLKEKFNVNDLDVFVVSYTKEKNHILKILNKLRRAGIRADFDLLLRKPKKQIQTAINKMSQYILFIGEDEIKSGKFGLKNTKTQEQLSLSIDEIINIICTRR